MCIGSNHPLKYSSLRRSEMCSRPANAPGCCAPTERETKCVPSGYKHIAPLGRNPKQSTRCTSKLNPRKF